MLGAADGAIEATVPVRGGDSVPQRDARAAQRGEAIFVTERRQVEADGVADEVPEQVAGVSVVSLFGE